MVIQAELIFNVTFMSKHLRDKQYFIYSMQKIDTKNKVIKIIKVEFKIINNFQDVWKIILVFGHCLIYPIY